MTVQRKAIQQYRQSYQSQEAVRSYDEEASASFRSHRSLRGIINALTVRAEQSTLTKMMDRIPAGGTILDVPCGTGKEFPVLRGRGRVIGADSSIAMLGLYVRKGGVESMRADISLLPLRNQSVDVVVCNRFLHRLPASSRAIVLSELRRVTRRWAVTYHGIAGPGRRFVIAFERALGLG